MNYINRHHSTTMEMEDAAELHQKEVDFLFEQMQRVEEYPYAVWITYKRARSVLAEHLVLYPDQEAKAIAYLRLMARASWYTMRLHFHPEIVFQGYWLDKNQSFQVKQGERKSEFNYRFWYHGILAAVILRDTVTIRFMLYDQKILSLLEAEDSQRHDVQFQAMLCELFLYYLSLQHERQFVHRQVATQAVLSLKLSHLNHYAEKLAQEYKIDQPCPYEKFTQQPKGKALDIYYHHHFCNLMIPCLHAFNALVADDETAFQNAYHKAVLTHKLFWQRDTEENGFWEELGCPVQNDYVGYFSITLTALAAMAHDKGYTLPVHTDYCPEFFIRYQAP